MDFILNTSLENTDAPLVMEKSDSGSDFQGAQVNLLLTRGRFSSLKPPLPQYPEPHDGKAAEASRPAAPSRLVVVIVWHC